MKGHPKSPSEIRRETNRLDAWARRELKNVMREAVTRMVAGGQGKRVPIPAASAAEYRDLRRSLRNAMERAVAFSDSRLLTAPNGSSPDRELHFTRRLWLTGL